MSIDRDSHIHTQTLTYADVVVAKGANDVTRLRVYSAENEVRIFKCVAAKCVRVYYRADYGWAVRVRRFRIERASLSFSPLARLFCAEANRKERVFFGCESSASGDNHPQHIMMMIIIIVGADLKHENDTRMHTFTCGRDGRCHPSMYINMRL